MPKCRTSRDTGKSKKRVVFAADLSVEQFVERKMVTLVLKKRKGILKKKSIKPLLK